MRLQVAGYDEEVPAACDWLLVNKDHSLLHVEKVRQREGGTCLMWNP